MKHKIAKPTMPLLWFALLVLAICTAIIFYSCLNRCSLPSSNRGKSSIDSAGIRSKSLIYTKVKQSSKPSERTISASPIALSIDTFEKCNSLPIGEEKAALLRMIESNPVTDDLLIDAFGMLLDEQTQCFVTSRLGNIATNDTVNKLVNRYSESQDATQRTNIINFLANLFDPKFHDSLHSLLEDARRPSDDPLVLAAMRSLVPVGNGATLEAIFTRLAHATDNNLVERYVTEISALKNPAIEVDIQQAARGEFILEKSNPIQKDALMRVRFAALSALHNYPTHETVTLLNEIAQQDADSRIRAMAAEALQSALRNGGL